MIIGTGIDVVDIGRFERQIARTPGLVARLFTPGERDLPVRSLAARFAAKEAAAKALKAPPGMIWQHCWIEKDTSGAPVLCTEGTVAEEARRQGIDRWHLTMTHDGGIAMAVVVAERTTAAPTAASTAAPAAENTAAPAAASVVARTAEAAAASVTEYAGRTAASGEAE